ncbi:hypothetical protein BJ742DRAFT_782649 [Cladochytrium replicatum]|nr:hypothetical protein BJ742DRAFT_782649 [Cladochytrium replicatum]
MDLSFQRGSLKLKGLGPATGGIKKKKRSKDEKEKLKAAAATAALAEKKEIEPEEESFEVLSKEAAAAMVEPVVITKKPSTHRKTPAEIKFEEASRKRRAEMIAKIASKSHKERVAEYNEKLEQMSEHHDLPKIGPG